MTKIPDHIIKQIQEDLLGKRIGIFHNEKYYEGICEFIGYNSFLPNWGFQVTINRLPLQHVDIKNIEIVEPRKKIFSK